MKEITIALKSIDDVKEFVKIVNMYDFDVDMVSGRHIVDAKSIMGIFSLDLSKPIKLEAHTDDGAAFFAELERFIVK